MPVLTQEMYPDPIARPFVSPETFFRPLNYPYILHAPHYDSQNQGMLRGTGNWTLGMTNYPSMPAPASFRFLDLPLEVRRKVYRFLLPKDIKRQWTSRKRSRREKDTIMRIHQKFAILSVNRQVYGEVVEELYQRVVCHVRFDTGFRDDILWFLQKRNIFGELIVTQFRHICFDIAVEALEDLDLKQQGNMRSLLRHLRPAMTSLKIILVIQKNLYDDAIFGDLVYDELKTALRFFFLPLQAVRGLQSCVVYFRKIRTTCQTIETPFVEPNTETGLERKIWSLLMRFKNCIESLAIGQSPVSTPEICTTMWYEYSNLMQLAFLAMPKAPLDHRVFQNAAHFDLEGTLRSMNKQIEELKHSSRKIKRPKALIQAERANVKRVEMLVTKTAEERGIQL